jgi:hypothetical protein
VRDIIWAVFNVYQSDDPLDDPSSERKMKMAVRMDDIVAFQEVPGFPAQSFLIVKVEDEPSKALRIDEAFDPILDLIQKLSR